MCRKIFSNIVVTAVFCLAIRVAPGFVDNKAYARYCTHCVNGKYWAGWQGVKRCGVCGGDGWIPDNDHSDIQVVTPPHIDRDGDIWCGSGSGGRSGSAVGKAKLTYDHQGRAYWTSHYRNNYGQVTSPVRANSKYDKLTGEIVIDDSLKPIQITPQNGYVLFFDGQRVGHEPNWTREQAIANFKANRQRYPQKTVSARYDGRRLTGYRLYWNGRQVGYEPYWTYQRALENLRSNRRNHPDKVVRGKFDERWMD